MVTTENRLSKIFQLNRDDRLVFLVMIVVVFMYKFMDVTVCSLRKILFVEKSEHYYKLDNWPPESERR